MLSTVSAEIVCTEILLFFFKCIYYIHHEAETHENRRFLSTEMEFAENAYAYVLKAPSRS